MKSLVVSILCFFLGGMVVRGAETVSLQLINLSPMIFPATARSLGLDFNLSISSLPDAQTVNWELAPATQNHGFTHEGFFILTDPSFFEPSIFPFVLNVPRFADVNTNGVYDFFDPRAAVENQTTQGRHPTASGGAANFTARWNRAGGESTGTVVMDLPEFGLRFTHAFNLLHFEGQFTFTREGTNLNGTVTLTNVFSNDDTITGPLDLRIQNNQTLLYSAGSWTPAAGGNYTFSPLDTLDAASTNFISLLSLGDGFLSTAEADYLDWFLIVNSADANRNGILDLVEGGAETRPTLEIVKGNNGIEITIHGTTGKTYQLEAVANIDSVAWQLLQSVTLAAATRTITLPPEGGRRFFRVRQS
jgi:hypothetical protein